MDGDMKIDYDAEGNLHYSKPQDEAPTQVRGLHFDNLATDMGEADLDSTATRLTELVSYDEDNKEEWQQLNADSLKLLGIGPESEPDDVDDEASDTSDHPLMLTALTRFLSKALAAMLPSEEEAVRTKSTFDLSEIKDPKEREMMQKDVSEAGNRVEKFYTQYLFRDMRGYKEDTDQLLFEMGMSGVGVRKVYMDLTSTKTPVKVCHVPMTDLFVSFDAKNFGTGRIAHRMNISTPDLIRRIRSGQYRAVEDLQDGDLPEKNAVGEELDRIVGLSSSDLQSTETHRIYEVHCELFLESDAHPLGLARPYIVTIHSNSMQVLSIVRNWKPNDEDEERIEHFAGYMFHPGKNAVYGIGLGHILANITRALRKAQRRGLEAAYLQNHPSGFKLSNFKVRDDSTKIRSGEFRDVDSPTGDIRSSLMLHPFQGPSAGLQALADKMESNGMQLGGLATADLDKLMQASVSPGPAMAAYEEGTEFQSSIHRRLYDGQALELRLVHDRMREIVGQTPLSYGANGLLHEGDLMKCDILPRMKPGQASKQKTVLEAQAILDLSAALPDVIDKRKAAIEYLRALGKSNLDDVLLPDPAENPPQPADPVSEYGAFMLGQPVTAGPAQNHMAHIDAHAAQMQGLQTSQLPVEKGEAMMAALGAHIAEHYALDTAVKVSTAIGIPLEQLQQGLPPEIEAQVAPQIAEAIKQIEAERAPPETQAEESKIAIEQSKQQGAQQLQTMKQAHETELQTMAERHEIALQAARDDAAMARAEQDDATAVEIASMKDANKASTKAGTVSK